MPDEELEGFTNVRARLQRLGDARFFSGWVDRLSRNDCWLRLAPGQEIDEGDRFSVEIHGEEALAAFPATATKIAKDRIWLRATDGIRFREAAEKVRYRLCGIYGTL